MFEKEITHSKMLQLQQTNLLLQQGMYDFTEVPLLQKLWKPRKNIHMYMYAFVSHLIS